MRVLSKILIAFLLAGVCAVPASAQDGGSYLVIYSRGPAWPVGAKVHDLPLKPHGRYLLQLYRDGRMRMAGPFTDDSGGAVLLMAKDFEHAQAMVKEDPAVLGHLFNYAIHPWAPVEWEQFLRPKTTLTPTPLPAPKDQ